MTRTVHVGHPRRGAAHLQAVLDAAGRGIEAVSAGRMRLRSRSATRNVLRKQGLGRYFTHSTGHGVGLEIHEAPRLAAGQEEILRPGMVITIEPGVYIAGQVGRANRRHGPGYAQPDAKS